MGYISGVCFQKCPKFSIIFFTLNISTKNHIRGACARPPKYAPGHAIPMSEDCFFLDFVTARA